MAALALESARGAYLVGIRLGHGGSYIGQPNKALVTPCSKVAMLIADYLLPIEKCALMVDLGSSHREPPVLQAVATKL